MHHKVFYLGHFRTGTTSFFRAARILGYVRCEHFPLEYFRHLYRVGNVDWDAPFDVMCNANEVEYPRCDRVYPGSKFILPIRDVDDWLLSIKYFTSQVRGDSEHIPWIRQRLETCLGSPVYDEQLYRLNYINQHNMVTEYFKGREKDFLLLPLDAASETKWDLICNFLGKPIPEEPYPYLNRTDGNNIC